MKKEYLILTIAIFLGLIINLVGAESIGVFKQNENVQLYQTCNNCTYCNFTTVKYPNSTNILTNILTTKDETYFYYDLGEGNTSVLGTWTYCYDCGNTVEKATGCLEFTITPSGKESSTSESILYTLFVTIIFGLLLIMFYFIATLPNENEKNENDVVIGIVRLKYLRIVLIALSYPVIMILLNLMNGLAVNFTTLTIFSGTLGFLFESMLRLIWPVTVIIAIWIFYLLIKDSNIEKNLKKAGRFKI